MLEAEDLNQFQTHKAANTKAKQTSYPFEPIMHICEREQTVILHAAMDESINKLLRIVKSNEAESLTQKAKIYPITLKQNQFDELPFYIQKLYEKIQSNEADIFGRQSKDILIKRRLGTDVREVLLDIYEGCTQIQGRPDFAFYIYIIEEVTDLSEDNLYIFSKGITNINFVAFLPTYSTFADDNYEAENKLKLDKFQTHIYDAKWLFSKYIYNCIKNLEIKAYLPLEVLNLVTDIDYYHLSYSQSCRRFNYCLFKALQINPSDRIQLDFNALIEKIQLIFQTHFLVKEHKTNWFNILEVILSDRQTYKISSTALSVEVGIRKANQQFEKYTQFQSQEDILIEKINLSIAKRLQKKELAIFLQNEDEVSKRSKITRDRKRMQDLQINTKVKLTPRIKLENNITRIIKTLTKEVRKHARSIKWSDINFNQRIKPCIPMKIVDSMKQKEGQMNELVEEITSRRINSLSYLLSLFNKDDIGYGLYLIKNLELAGLFSLSKRQINPLVCNNFYQKTKFH